jgi:tetratricopeptide (TPR) repeat protein
MMNDRYLYYPMLGMAPFAVLSINGAFEMLRPRLSFVAPLCATVVILACAAISLQRVDIWKTPLNLWADTMAKTGSGTWYATDANFVNYMYADAQVIHARQLRESGNENEARRFYHLALTYDPTHYYGLVEISIWYLVRQKPLVARPYLARLTELYKKSDEGHFLMGISLANTGDTGLAMEEFRTALALNPQHERARKRLKQLEESTGKALKTT